MTQSNPIVKTNYKYGFHKPELRFLKPLGLSQQVVEAISHYKKEPDWMRQFRLQALKFLNKNRCRPGVQICRI